jgi:hypothetical protein
MHDSMVNLASSAFAGTVGRICFHPIDTFKANMQVSQDGQKILMQTLRKESASTGVRALYRGLGVGLVGGVPATALYLNSYDYAKKHLGNAWLFKNSPFSVYLLGGLFAEAVSCVVFVPVDVIKERMQVQGVNKSSAFTGKNVPEGAVKEYYKSSLDALSKIFRQEGVYGLYKGYGASMISFGPFSALYFGFHEEMKKLVASYGGDTRSTAALSFRENLLCASVAGASAAWITNPLDLVKLRLQVRRANKAKLSTEALDSTFGLLRYIYATEGLRVFFRGAGARVLFHAPNTAVTVS